jgi:hypothetical protein
MYRHGRMVPLTMFAVLMLYTPPASSPRVEQTAAPVALPLIVPGIQRSPDNASPSVRIEHELVRLPKPRPQRINRPQWRSTRLATVEPADEPHAPLIVRARRALVGNGRYKPEPFPRVEPAAR